MTYPKLITKRDGQAVEFSIEKIKIAISKAGESTKEFGIDVAEKLTQQTLDIIEKNNDYQNLTVEKVQDYVEEALIL